MRNELRLRDKLIVGRNLSKYSLQAKVFSGQKFCENETESDRDGEREMAKRIMRTVDKQQQQQQQLKKTSTINEIFC